MMKHQGGFTIAELIIVVVIAAILAAVAVPNLSEFVKDNARSARLNTMVTALNYARNQAVTRNARVSLCKSANVTTTAPTCDAVPGSGNFEGGWIVVTDHVPAYLGGAVGTFDEPDDPRCNDSNGDGFPDDLGCVPNEEVLRRFNPDMGNSTLIATNINGAFRGITFDATGLGSDMALACGTLVCAQTEFKYCDDRDEGRTIEISPTGFASVAGPATVCP